MLYIYIYIILIFIYINFKKIYQATPLIGCFTKHECEDDEFRGNNYMLKDLL